jgi:PAS domain S-box-containing protein
LQKTVFIYYEDLPFKAKQGERREVEFIGNIYSKNGNQVIQCNIRDITERKYAEMTLQESKELPVSLLN